MQNAEWQSKRQNPDRGHMRGFGLAPAGEVSLGFVRSFCCSYMVRLFARVKDRTGKWTSRCGRSGERPCSMAHRRSIRDRHGQVSANGEPEKASRGHAVSKDFLRLAGEWCLDQSAILVGFLWGAYDQLKRDCPAIDEKDLERSITQLLEVRIRREMSGDEPFYIQHSPFERETMKRPPAQPPQYDLAFVLNVDERIMWPLEAKVLETPSAVSKYASEVRDQLLACRYAPFCGEGAMLGYLLSGTPADAFSQRRRTGDGSFGRKRRRRG